MHIRDYNDAMKFFRDSKQLESNGKWKEFVEESKFDDMLQEPRTMANGGSLVGTPTKEVTQFDKRIYKTPGGELVSEKSKTFYFNGKWVNVPSIHDGVQYDSEERLRNMLKHGKIQATSEHGSRIEAEEAAGLRSDMMKSHVKGFDDGGQVIGKPGGLVEPGVMYYATSRVKKGKFKYEFKNQAGTFYSDTPVKHGKTRPKIDYSDNANVKKWKKLYPDKDFNKLSPNQQSLIRSQGNLKIGSGKKLKNFLLMT